MTVAVAADYLEIIQTVLGDRLQVEVLEEIGQAELPEPLKQWFSGVQTGVANSNPLLEPTDLRR